MYGRVMGAFGGTRCIKFVGQDFYGAVCVTALSQPHGDKNFG